MLSSSSAMLVFLAWGVLLYVVLFSSALWPVLAGSGACSREIRLLWCSDLRVGVRESISSGCGRGGW